jgi:hypothetical protein
MGASRVRTVAAHVHATFDGELSARAQVCACRVASLWLGKRIATLSKARDTTAFHFAGPADAASIVNSRLSVHAIQVGYVLPGPNSMRLASTGV